MLLRVIFSKRTHIGSWLIRVFTWSRWSHCAVLTPDGTVIEASANHGAREVGLATFLMDKSAYGWRLVEVPSEADAIAFARGQLGKPYDWQGVFAIVLRRDNWQAEDSWFCSELVEAAIAAGGRQRFIHDAPRVTPEHSWMVA